MTARLVNVRLDPKRVRKAQMLREHGITLSDVLRQAIDERFEALHQRERDIDVAAVVRSILERHPDPADLPPRDYDVHDPRAARAAIRSRLKRSRP
jgi:hypothetical protein